ncbi:hypothetical protein [Cochleicola gelatinilyticus]|uniref:Late embryogenesis abundant protein LEA-2 subgroup domain-containing protein n=1 Tax=Cochleicola gelatinilyticus TaxID=1763537 RepID=A0A167IKS8_9FLAO|nr:hypothetical protein [Cochleicola gelatinilyticus]OAB79755.1 hypothetical protein ULVI_03140 [Cochleicola gelatinilyticus]
MKLLKYAAIAYATYYVFGKASNAYSVYKNIKTRIIGVKNVAITGRVITLNVDVAVSNPTPNPFSLNAGGLVTISKVNIYSKNKIYIGSARPNVSSLEIPAYGTTILEAVPATIETTNMVQIITQLDQLSELITTVEIQAAGQTIVV